MDNQAKKGKPFSWQSIFPARISLQEQILLVKHMSMMLQSGMSEVESLRVIQSQTKKGSLAKMLKSVIANVENGQFLSESLRPFRKSFGDLIINVIKLGEISGTLPENLDYLAEEIKKKQELRSKVRSALIYPVVILLATIGVTGSIIVFILPKILPIFQSLNIKLPLTTVILVAIANFLQAYYLYIIAAIPVVVVGWIYMLRIPGVRFILTKIFLMVPIAGKINKDYNMANISRTLGLLLKSGVKIVEALIATAESVNNPVYKKALREAVEEVKKGGSIHKYMLGREKLFPPTLTRMVQIGETTGNLDKNLSYLSNFYENELGDKVKNLSSVLEPLLMLTMGLIVGLVAVSIVTPIYEVTQSLSK